MKKISFLLGFIILFFMTSCTVNPDSDILGEWEIVNIKENEWWYYNYEDGTISDTQYYADEYSLNPEHPEWYMVRIKRGFMTIKEAGADVDEIIVNVPFPYTFNGNKLTSILLAFDHTNSVTVSFPNDNTMIWYVDDSGDLEESSYGGYEHYEAWMTFRRVE